MNTIQLTESIGAIVAKDYRKAEVFKSMGIDFWCNGEKTLNEASQEAGISSEKLIAALDQISLSETACFPEFAKWEPDALIDYIINTHHQYAKTNAVIIYDLVQKVAYQHSEWYPGLIKLVATMFLFLHDLLNQMVKEEQILFPNIRQLIKYKSCSGKCEYANVGLIREQVSLMHMELHTAIKKLKYFHELTNNYLLPEDACNSYKYLFEKMKEFEADFFLHAHLENNILLPSAMAEVDEHDENALVIVK